MLQLAGLIVAAYYDQTLILLAPGVGLLQHPGIFSVVVGDSILFVLASISSKRFLATGVKIPTKKPVLIERYFRSKIVRLWFGKGSGFVLLFLSISIIGCYSLINQSLKLQDPVFYYKHDTFDGYTHFYSFWVNRINLFISWCVMIPLFSAYLISYMISVNRLFGLASKKGLLDFRFRHPDRAGGFAFFGDLNIFYMAGLLVIAIETILLIYAHRHVSISNFLAMAAVAVGFVGFTYLSVYEPSRAIKKLEVEYKSADFERFNGNQSIVDSYHLLLHYIMSGFPCIRIFPVN